MCIVCVCIDYANAHAIYIPFWIFPIVFRNINAAFGGSPQEEVVFELT